MAYTGADNSYNRMFNDISEIKFSRLLRDPLFREGPKRKDNNPRLLEYRKGRVADILKQAKEHTKTFMALGYDETNPDDRVFSKLIDIADGFNLSEIDYGMKALSSGEDALWSPNTDVGDLDYMKLLRLENYLEFREAVEDRGF
jgi:hypothetical protein